MNNPVAACRSSMLIPTSQIEVDEHIVHITHVDINLINDGFTIFTKATGIIAANNVTGIILKNTFFMNSIIGQPIKPFII